MSPRIPTPEEQAELSAYLDGELETGAAALLRERLDREPSLATQLRELEAVDEGLRAIPPAEVPRDLAARMHDRIAAERGAADVVALRRAARPRPALRRALYATAALAAAVAIALLMRSQLAGGPTPQLAAPEAAPRDQPLEEREARELIAPKLPAPPSLPVPEVPTPVAPAPVEPRAIAAPERIAESVPDAIESASDEDLLLVLGLEALGADAGELEDLAIIEQLEFVERLRQLETGGRRG